MSARRQRQVERTAQVALEIECRVMRADDTEVLAHVRGAARLEDEVDGRRRAHAFVATELDVEVLVGGDVEEARHVAEHLTDVDAVQTDLKLRLWYTHKAVTSAYA